MIDDTSAAFMQDALKADHPKILPHPRQLAFNALPSHHSIDRNLTARMV